MGPGSVRPRGDTQTMHKPCTKYTHKAIQWDTHHAVPWGAGRFEYFWKDEGRGGFLGRAARLCAGGVKGARRGG